MNTYSAYKDSGEQWLGQIPAHWEMRQWRFLLKENVTPNTDCKETQQLQFKYGEIIPKANQEIDSDTLKIICKYNKVQPNDIMINGLNLNYDFISQRIGMVRTNGIITSAYISLRPIGSANPSYYNYLLKAMDAQKMFHGMGTGVRLTLSYKELKSKYLPFPTEAEQEAMVAYLDEQAGKLDQTIAREQKMIDLLEERKQIIIQQAVTKGLNPNAPMKDSGIEWIGEMPEHWDLTRLKRFVKFISGFAFNSNSFSDSGVRVIRIGDISKSIDFENCARSNQRSAKLEQFRIRENDILIAMSGATTGKCCIAENVVEAYINQRVGIIRCAKPRFIYYALKTKLFSEYVNITNAGSAQPNISSSGICNYPLVMPTDEEQNQIVIYLDKHIANVDRAIEAREKMIALLQERKQIIINEVVTGKIKVS